MKNKKLLFVGNYGNRNIGDDSILSILSKRYKKEYTNYTQFVIARHFDEDIQRLGQISVLSFNINSILTIIKEFDLIVIGGGGIFGKETGPYAKLIPIFAIFCQLLAKKVIYESIGFYPSASLYLKVSIFLSMLSAQKISVRDDSSFKELSFIRKLKNIELVDDPAYNTKAASKKEVEQILLGERIITTKPFIGLSIKRIKDRKVNKKIEGEIKKLIIYFSKNEFSILFISFCHNKDIWEERDLEYNLEIASKLKNKNIFVLKKYYTPQKIAGLVKLTNLFIGMRYHSQVFAHIMKTPLIPLVNYEKNMDFIKKHNYQSINVRNFEYNDIINYAKERIQI